jgi:hypothetical protein
MSLVNLHTVTKMNLFINMELMQSYEDNDHDESDDMLTHFHPVPVSRMCGTLPSHHV